MTIRRHRWHALIERLPHGVPLLGAEIGVWTGKLSEQLLRAFPLLHLYLVDRWQPPTAGDSYASSGALMATYDAATYTNALDMTRRKLVFAGARARFLIGDSAAMAAKVRDHSLDFAFIDGDHSYEGCLRDLRAWAPKVMPGGWLCGHDWEHPDQGGVKEAVLEFLSTEPELDDNRTWFFRMQN